MELAVFEGRRRGSPPDDGVFLVQSRRVIHLSGRHVDIPRKLPRKCVQKLSNINLSAIIRIEICRLTRPRRSSGVSTLPAELQRNFGLIRELDEKSSGMKNHFMSSNVVHFPRGALQPIFSILFSRSAPHRAVLLTPFSAPAGLMVDVEQYISDFQRSNHQKITDQYPEDTVKRLRTNLQTCMELGDEKVALAVQTYELVCSKIQSHSLKGRKDQPRFVFSPQIRFNMCIQCYIGG
jgi:hypothetical protein